MSGIKIKTKTAVWALETNSKSDNIPETTISFAGPKTQFFWKFPSLQKTVVIFYMLTILFFMAVKLYLCNDQG